MISRQARISLIEETVNAVTPNHPDRRPPPVPPGVLPDRTADARAERLDERVLLRGVDPRAHQKRSRTTAARMGSTSSAA